jgi:hypothetical protein
MSPKKVNRFLPTCDLILGKLSATLSVHRGNKAKCAYSIESIR